jgi:IclR family KDG regulon transcriptional repressor
LAKNRYSINSILRALKILDSFTFEKPAYTNQELAKKLGLNKSTITALLSSLEEGGFLEKDEKTREYRLTYRLYQLGRVYISQIDLRNVAIPLLTELAVSCKETVHIGFLNKFTVFNIETIESSQPVGIRIIRELPTDAHGSAMGKALLAHLDKEQLDEYFSTAELTRHTPNTITSEEDLRNHLARVRENGFALDDMELFDDVRCVGAPIFNSESKVIAAMSVSGPVFRMTREKIKHEYIPAVKNTAFKISQKLGYLKS